MELKTIEGLLEKYFEAETTPQEEAQLKEYFGSGEVAPHLSEYTAMFQYFRQSKEEVYSGKAAFRPGRKKVYAWVGMAASIAIMAGVFTASTNGISEFGTHESPELAMQKTKEALRMISENMNTGTEDLMYLQEFNNTKNKILK